MKLKDYIKEEEMTEQEFARSIGVSQPHINFIVRGKRNPSFELAKIIEEKTKGIVTFSDLFNPNVPSRLRSRKKKKTPKIKKEV